MKSILMVCLGNICRSPLAEGILTEKCMKENLDVYIDSCGTGGWHIDEKPDRRAVAIGMKNDVDIRASRGRQFSIDDFNEFDEIFAMDKDNYESIMTFTRNEEDKKKVKLILNEVEAGKNLSVPDPYYGGEKGFQNVFETLDNACNHIIKRLKKEV